MSTSRPVLSRDDALVEAAQGGELQAAGVVLTLAAVGWFVHFAMMLITFLALAYYGFNIGLHPTGVVALSLTTFVAVVSASDSALLLSVVSLLLARGLRPISWRDPNSGQVRTLSGAHRRQLVFAGAALIAFGALGLSLLVVMANPPEGITAGALLGEIGARWVPAAILLVFMALLQGGAYRQLVSLVRPETRLGGALFLAYSVTNLVGVLVLLGSLFALTGGTIVRSEVQLWPLYAGTLLTFVVAPVIGALAFGGTVWLARGFRRAGTGFVAQSAWFAPEWFRSWRKTGAEADQRPAANPPPSGAPALPIDGRDHAPGSPPRDGVSAGTDRRSEPGLGGGTQLIRIQEKMENERAILMQLEWRFANRMISREVFDLFAKPRIRRMAELQADADRILAGSSPPPAARGNETVNSPE